MPYSTILTTFSCGEITPSLLGRVDLEKYHEGARTMRNFFVNYRGGAASRAGTSFVGVSKQTGAASGQPPRLIPFQFSQTQGYILEFGDQYMRIIYNGAYAVESPFTISSIVQQTELTVTTTSAHGYSGGDAVYISGNTASSIGVNNSYFTVGTVPSSTTFTIVPQIGGTLLPYFSPISYYAASDTIQTGTHILFVASVSALYIGQAITVVPTSSPSYYMMGTVTNIQNINGIGAYSVTINVTSVNGSGNFTGANFYNSSLYAISTSTMTIGTGSVSFTVNTLNPISVGQTISINDTAAPANYMLGTVTAYTQATGAITVNVTSVSGSGTFSAWQLSPYGTGGSVERVYTVVTPYAAVDLPYLKYAQSADVMSLCCVNQVTLTEYAPYDLARVSANSWTLTATSFSSAIAAPTGLAAVATNSQGKNTYYSYVVTSVSSKTGEESIASSAVSIENNDISIYAGSNTLTWNTVTGASSYNVYGTTASYNAPVPISSAYNYMGSSFGPSFVDTNIIGDATRVPPTNQNPFARGQITNVIIANGGSGYAQATTSYTVTTSTGSGFIGAPVVSAAGVVIGFVIQSNGQGYLSADYVSIVNTGGGSGTGAVTEITLGAQSGTYPGVVSYYQQRRVYGYSINNPDTYWMTQIGAYTNMDYSIPTSDTDAISGTPWAQQVNGIQFFAAMPGGLVTLTGLGAWQVNGGNNASLTPADQTATPQAYNGCNSLLPPIRINYDILYVQAKGSIVRDLSYNFFVNIYTGADQTFLSSQLFQGFTLTGWAYSEEPYKVVWATRSDGALLSFTYLKDQNIFGWARHDTNGQFISTASVTELPVDATYFVTQRLIQNNGNPEQVYMIERMDNRLWTNSEDCWCVDSGKAYTPTYPNATLTAASATGPAQLGAPVIISGGHGYTAPTVVITDPTGSGGVIHLTLTSGVITAATLYGLTGEGGGYTNPTFTIVDATGSGGVITCPVINPVLFTASSAVFTASEVGDVIRIGGGKAVITSVNVSSYETVVANIIDPILATTPNDPLQTPLPAVSGAWSIGTPVTQVYGLNHLEGMTVAIVADGSELPQQVVVNGSVTLPQPASWVTVGLPYTCQLQTLPLDPPGQPVTTQGKRKNIYRVIVRTDMSRGLEVGTNQVNPMNEGYPVIWDEVGKPGGMKSVKDRPSSLAPGSPIALYTGDHVMNVPASWNEKGQIAIQQESPMPANILALICDYQTGDTAG